MSDLKFELWDGDLGLIVTVIEVDGSLQVTIEIAEDSDVVGDIGGAFFNLSDDTILDGLIVTSDVAHSRSQFKSGAVSNLGAGVNVNGDIVRTYGALDGGVSFGTPGRGKDDLQSVTFTLSHETEDLDLSLLSGELFAVRVTSVGEEGGQRNGSSKLVGQVAELGAISGRVFFDTDHDARDNNNGDEPGVAGVLVLLLDSDGNATGRSTTSGADGSYSFTGIAAGDYTVQFTDPDDVLDGKQLVAPDVGSDNSDSDATGTVDLAVIDGITVVAGEESQDNDFGVETIRFAPVLYRPQDGTPVFADAVVVNDEHRVFFQNAVRLAALPDGGYIAVWVSSDPASGDDSFSGVVGQIYNADGSVRLPEFLINTEMDGFQGSPDVSVFSDGSFVVTFLTRDGDPADPGGLGVAARRFDADGDPIGDEFLVNTVIEGSQSGARVAALADGRFAATWSGPDSVGAASGELDIYQQIYDADGNPVGGETRVNSSTDQQQSGPQVAALSDGGHVVVYSDFMRLPDNSFIRRALGQRYDETGAKDGAEFVIDETTTGFANPNSVVGLADGGFAVAWLGYDQLADGRGIFMRIYDADGTAQGARIPVSLTNDVFMVAPDIVELADGGLLVTWSAPDSGTSTPLDIYGRRFDADGNAVSGEFVINQSSEGSQSFSSAVPLLDGRVFVAWTERSGATEGDDITGQLLDEVGPRTHIASDSATVVDGQIQISDLDSTELVGATVEIVDSFEFGDVLALDGPLPGGVSMSYADGLLEISGTASLAEYEEWLQSVVFETADDPASTATRTIAFQVNDGDAGLSNILTREVSIIDLLDL